MTPPSGTPSQTVPTFVQRAPSDRTWLCMGTQLYATLEAPDRARAQEAVLAEVSRIEALASTWRTDTPWSRLNAARGEALPLDRESLELLGQCTTWTRLTNGAFDPVLASLIRLHGLRDQRRVPDAESLREALSASGVGQLHLDFEKGTAQLRDPRAGLEEGAFLKGYALDRARDVARQQGAQSGLLDFGGQLLAWGPPRRIAISDSRDRQQERLVLWLRDASLSTSGCSQRGRHILDPHSGQLCPDWGSVSVLMTSAFEADVLSTALYVMGPDQGLDWARQHRVSAVFLPHGQAPRVSEAGLAFHPTPLP